jgi:hypothetical protein
MTLVIALRSGVEDAAALSVPGELMDRHSKRPAHTRQRDHAARQAGGRFAARSDEIMSRLMGKRPCRRRALPQRETGCCGEIAVYGVTFFNYFKVFIYP